MQNVLIVFHLLVVVALIVVVLMQRSEGGALGIGGGSGGFFTGRGQANALTRATSILAGLFFLTSLGLSMMASYSSRSKSIIDAPAAPAAGKGELPALQPPVLPSAPVEPPRAN